MTAIARYLTHSEVLIDPAVAPPDWGLGPIGRERVEALAAAGWLAGATRIVSSGERKAREAAAVLADALGLDVEIRPSMHENDRSSTGFLPPPEFEAMADAFFASPDISTRGWEPAIDAQARIVAEAEAVLAHSSGDVVFMGHGAVGTLLMCRYAGLEISRAHDQPRQGCYFSFEIEGRRVLHRWRTFETPPDVFTEQKP